MDKLVRPSGECTSRWPLFRGPVRAIDGREGALRLDCRGFIHR